MEKPILMPKSKLEKNSFTRENKHLCVLCQFILNACEFKMRDTRIVIDAEEVILGEHDVVKHRVLFITQDGIIVTPSEGISNWTIAFVIVAFAVAFTGLFLRNLLLLLVGLVAGTTGGLIIGLFDFVLRRRRLSNMKRHDSKSILGIGKNNFEILYSRIARVEVTTLGTYPGASYLFPSFQDNQYKIDFVIDELKHTFILGKGKLEQCLKMLRQYAPTIEIEGTPIDE